MLKFYTKYIKKPRLIIPNSFNYSTYIHQDEYEDYTNKSKVYDIYRKPVGINNLYRSLQISQLNSKLESIDKLNILDIGCGTGNYINLLKSKVNKCTGVDINKKMIYKSRKKFYKDTNVEIREGSILNLQQLNNESFDSIIISQVLHHINSKNINKAFSEVNRVLKPGGTIWIQTQTPQQHVEGFWWSPIIHKASTDLAMRFYNIQILEKKLEKMGLFIKDIDIPNEPLIYIDKYRDKYGPFCEIYRGCDSTWSLATIDDIKTGLQWWKYMIDKGYAENYIQKREEIRNII